MTGGLKRLSQSSFVRGVAALSGAQIASVAIPLMAAPIIGRLYTPAEYGPLAAYMAFSGILGPLSSLSFDKAIVAERTEKGARALVGITIGISLAVALAVLLVVVPVIAFGQRAQETNDVWLWFLALPISVALAGIGFAGTEYAVRHGRFGLIGRRRVAISVVPVVATIGFGFAGYGANGPIIGYLIGQLASVALILRFFDGIGRADLRPPAKRARSLIRKHRDFVFFTTPSILMTNMSMQAPVFALTSMGALPLLGAFVRARQLVFMPLTLVGHAIGQVFRSHAMQHIKATGTCGPLYDRTLLVLLTIGIPGVVILWFAAPPFFTFYMGPDWTEAGYVAQMLSPLLLLRLLISPLGSIFELTGNQRIAFILNTIFCFLLISLLAWVVLHTKSEVNIIEVYAVIVGMSHLSGIIFARTAAWRCR